MFDQGWEKLREETFARQELARPIFCTSPIERMDREESLDLCRRLESMHLTFLLPGVLVEDFRPVVFCIAGFDA